jgi:hypothetical protein
MADAAEAHGGSRLAPAMVIAASLAVAGSQQVEKYFGAPAVGIYFVATIGLLCTARRSISAWLRAAASDRSGWILALLTLTALVLLFSVGHPLADSGRFGGGSDSDDALNLAARALFDGRYPYYVRTYLGAPATYLPGSLLLAVPFVMVGNAAWQNLFWIVVLIAAVAATWRNLRSALLLVWTAVILCPRVLQLLITGGELLASGIYVPLAVVWCAHGLRRHTPPAWWWATAAVLGVALSSRFNYLLIVPPVLAAVAGERGWRHAALYGVVVAAGFGAVTLPFWVHDPDAFWIACIEEQNFAALRLNAMLPHASMLLPAASGIAAIAISLPRFADPRTELLARCGAVQAVPVLAAVALCSVQYGQPVFEFAGYGVHFLFFGLLAAWTAFTGERYALRSAAEPERAR